MLAFFRTAGGGGPRGYTLIEMAIAASILGLVSMASGPSVFRAMEALRFRRAVEDMAGVLRIVRAEAIAARRTTHVAFNAGNGQFHTARDENANGVIDATEWRPLATRIPTQYIGSASPPVGRFSARGIFFTSTGLWAVRLNGPDSTVRFLNVLPSGHIAVTESAMP